MIEFPCKKCGQIVAKRDGNLLFYGGAMLSLFQGGFAIPCACGETFYFEFRKAGNLPYKKQLLSPVKNVNNLIDAVQ